MHAAMHCATGWPRACHGTSISVRHGTFSVNVNSCAVRGARANCGADDESQTVTRHVAMRTARAFIYGRAARIVAAARNAK